MSESPALSQLSQTPPAQIVDGRIIAEVGTTVWIPIRFFCPNPSQPRRWFDPEELQATAKSYAYRGDVEEPVKVTLRDDGTVALIVDGESRWRAANIASLAGLSAYIKPEMTDNEVYRSSAVSNIRRKNFSVIEQALAVFELQQRFDLDQNAAGEILGMEPPSVTYLMPFLDLHPKIQMLVMQGKLGAGIARQFAKFKVEEQLGYLNGVIEAKKHNGGKPIHPNKVARILRGEMEKRGTKPKQLARGRSHSTHAQLVARNLLTKTGQFADAIKEFGCLNQKTVQDLADPHFLDIENSLQGIVRAIQKQLDRLSRQT